MPSWLQTVVLTWLAKLTFTTSDVRRVKQDAEETAAKFLELFKTRKMAGSRNVARDGKLMESVCLLAPEWDSTYELNGEGKNGCTTGKILKHVNQRTRTINT